MRIGIFAKTFGGTDPLSVLKAAQDAGYDCVQYNFACSGLPSLPDRVTEEVLEAIAVARTKTGVDIVALSATYNMIHPDKAVRADGLVRLGVAIRAAADLGIPLVTLCTGTRDPDNQWRHHTDNQTPAAWTDLVSEMRKAVALAEVHGIQLGIEPEQANVVQNAADAERLMREIGSDTLRIVLDPANLFERATADEGRTIIADAIDRLSGRIALAHAKDRDADGNFVTAGQGVVDFPDFLARLDRAGFSGTVVTHGLSPVEAPGVAQFLRELT